MNRFVRAAVVALLVPAVAASMPPPPAPSRGKALFIAQGCSLCHGTVGQGAPGVGAALVPLHRSDAQVLAYVRVPRGVMPLYRPDILPDGDVVAIASYLRALPAPTPIDRIRLLAPYRAPAAKIPAGAPAAATAGAGRALFAQNCAACHGAERQGGMGPSLIGEARKRDAAAIAALLAAPPPGMPRFVPDQMTKDQARAVADFVVQP